MIIHILTLKIIKISAAIFKNISYYQNVAFYAEKSTSSIIPNYKSYYLYNVYLICLWFRLLVFGLSILGQNNWPVFGHDILFQAIFQSGLTNGLIYMFGLPIVSYALVQHYLIFYQNIAFIWRRIYFILNSSLNVLLLAKNRRENKKQSSIFKFFKIDKNILYSQKQDFSCILFNKNVHPQMVKILFFIEIVSILASVCK